MLQSTACLSLAALLLTSSTDAILTPNGVPVVQVSPVMRWPSVPAIPGCVEPYFNSLTHPFLRPYSGLHKLSQDVIDAVTYGNSITSKAQRRAFTKVVEGGSGNDSYVGISLCGAHKVVTDSVSFAKGVCQCDTTRKPKDICESTRYVLPRIGCGSDYPTDPEWCAKLKAPDFGVKFSSQCMTSISGNQSSLDLPLENLLYPRGKTLDTVISDDVIKAEGRTYYLLHKGLDKLGRAAEAVLHCGANLPDFEVVPTWKTVQHIYTIQPGNSDQKPTPFIVISRKGDESFLITVRDFRTTYEGRMVVQYDHGYKFLDGNSGRVHKGYAAAAQIAFPVLDQFFWKFFKSNWRKTELGFETTLKHPRIVVAGAGNFGGAVAAIIAEYVAKRWGDEGDKLNGWAANLKVDAVLFNAPNVGDDQFSASYELRVNGRNIFSTYSPNKDFPCTTAMHCGAADAEVPTGKTGDLSTYTMLKGRVEFNPMSSPSFVAENYFWASPLAGLEFVPQGLCAPRCFLSLNFCPDEEEQLCKASECPFQGVYPLLGKEDL